MPRIKIKKKSTQSELYERDGEDQTSPACSSVEDNDMPTDGEQASNASLDLILGKTMM